MNITSLEDGLVQIEKNGKLYLGIALGTSGRTFGLRKLTEASGPRGWIVGGDKVERWDTYGIVENDGLVYLYGTMHDFLPLAGVVSLAEDEALVYVERLAQALDVMTRSELCPRRIHTHGVLFLDGGRILFLGDHVVDRMTDISEEASRITLLEQLNHPDYEGPANAVFAVSVLVYRILSGEWPYTADSEEAIHTHIREAHALRPELLRPSLDLSIAAIVFECIQKPSGRTFEQWVRDLHDWRDSGYTREISDSERSELARKAEATRLSMNKSLTRREMVRKHWKQTVVIALAVIIAGSIPMSMLRNYLEPRRTAGMAPQEVVETFLYAQNALDHDLMEDAVVDRAGQQYVREATNLFVVSRMRMSVEMNDSIVDPVAWTENGRPDLEPGQWVYGVVNAELEEISSSDESAVFRVRYERWSPEQDTQGDPEDIDLETPLGFSGTMREDIFRLRREQDDWVIFEIEPQSQSPIVDW